jgi:glycerol-3-phosphate dehydrogenase
MAELFGWSAGVSTAYAEQLERELQLAVEPKE